MQYKKEHLIIINDVMERKIDSEQILGPDGFSTVKYLYSSCMRIGNNKTYQHLSTVEKQAYQLIVDELMDFLSDKDIAYCFCAIRVCIFNDIYIYPRTTKCVDMMNKLTSVMKYVRNHRGVLDSIPEVVTIKTEETNRVC